MGALVRFSPCLFLYLFLFFVFFVCDTVSCSAMALAQLLARPRALLHKAPSLAVRTQSLWAARSSRREVIGQTALTHRTLFSPGKRRLASRNFGIFRDPSHVGNGNTLTIAQSVSAAAGSVGLLASGWVLLAAGSGGVGHMLGSPEDVLAEGDELLDGELNALAVEPSSTSFDPDDLSSSGSSSRANAVARAAANDEEEAEVAAQKQEARRKLLRGPSTWSLVLKFMWQDFFSYVAAVAFSACTAVLSISEANIMKSLFDSFTKSSPTNTGASAEARFVSRMKQLSSVAAKFGLVTFAGCCCIGWTFGE